MRTILNEGKIFKEVLQVLERDMSECKSALIISILF